MKRALPFVIIFAVLVAAVVAALHFNRSTGQTHVVTPATNVSSSPQASPLVNTAVVDAPGAIPPHALGDPNARVTLEEFGDFQCPPCGMLHPVLKTMEGE